MQGIELCRRYYAEIVQPILDSEAIQHSAALIGPGSEVLGYDTEMSRDHDWGPRVILFLTEADFGLCEQVRALLMERAPQQFEGFPVDQQMTVITTLHRFMFDHLGIQMNEPLELIDWLTFSSQSMLEITKGEVFQDRQQELTDMRSMFHYYPHDIWLYLLASTWQRIGQEEHLMLRSGFVGDELGSSVIASRLVHDVMNLCFLLERQYAPYPKWFGTAFRQLRSAENIMQQLWKVQTADAWRKREEGLMSVYTNLANLHNGLGITEEITDEAASFFDRPFKVMHGSDIAALISKQIKDPDVRWLAEHRLIGGMDQITDNTDFRQLYSWPEGRGEIARNTFKQLFKPNLPD